MVFRNISQYPIQFTIEMAWCTRIISAISMWIFKHSKFQNVFTQTRKMHTLRSSVLLVHLSGSNHIQIFKFHALNASQQHMFTLQSTPHFVCNLQAYACFETYTYDVQHCGMLWFLSVFAVVRFYDWFLLPSSCTRVQHYSEHHRIDFIELIQYNWIFVTIFVCTDTVYQTYRTVHAMAFWLSG